MREKKDMKKKGPRLAYFKKWCYSFRNRKKRRRQMESSKITVRKAESEEMNLTMGLLTPFIGTFLGSAMVLFLKNKMSDRVEKALLGFAAGVMIAASVWSLLIPSIEKSREQGVIAWLPPTIGFLGGVAFLLLLDCITPHLHLKSGAEEGPESRRKKLTKSTMLMLAVTLHNVPEGMAVGVVFAGALTGESGVTMAGAFALALGIAIQNFPEGAIISMPLKTQGTSKGKAFLLGALSGIVEPIAAVITLIFVREIIAVLPYLLAFAAGAMIYVVVEELIPESQVGKHSNIGTIGAALGFVVMMILDVALG